MAVTQTDLDNSTLLRVDGLNHEEMKQALITADGIGYFDTLADFKASTKVYKEVHISGYYSTDDNAFGSNSHSLLPSTVSDTEIGGVKVKTASGRHYELNFKGDVEASYFGAIGNSDVTNIDYTSELQEFINYLSEDFRPGHIEAGTYNFTDLYLFHDDTLNPGYRNLYAGHIMISGDVRNKVTNLIWDQPQGTILQSSTGRIYAGLGQYNRKGNIHLWNMSIMCDVPDFALEIEEFDFCSLRNILIQNKNSAGSGLRIGDTFNSDIDGLLIASNHIAFIPKPSAYSTGVGFSMTVGGGSITIDHARTRGFNYGFDIEGSGDGATFKSSEPIFSNVGWRLRGNLHSKMIDCNGEWSTYTHMAIHEGATVTTIGNTHSNLAEDWYTGASVDKRSFCVSNGNIYVCVQPGVTANAPTGTGSGIVDGTAIWDYDSPYMPLIDGAEKTVTWVNQTDLNVIRKKQSVFISNEYKLGNGVTGYKVNNASVSSHVQIDYQGFQQGDVNALCTAFDKINNTGTLNINYPNYTNFNAASVKYNNSTRMDITDENGRSVKKLSKAAIATLEVSGVEYVTFYTNTENINSLSTRADYDQIGNIVKLVFPTPGYVVEHGTGNITLKSGANFTSTEINKVLTLMCISATSWVEV